MNNQCEHCGFSGNLKLCEQTECEYHENWYAIVLHVELAHRDRAMMKLAEHITNHCPLMSEDRGCRDCKALGLTEEDICNIVCVEWAMKKTEE